ncbi:unnamed protein product [Calicophoron daubneyi]|uniref:PHD-type domain-containing protein n=1 Tax=Calicophoron daubneyi TaxID=300641 RepID=A0AAV2TSX6_CALDB
MPRKKLARAPPGACVLCLTTDNHPLLGDLREKNGITVHINCIFAASGIFQEDAKCSTNGKYIEGFSLSAIEQEVHRGRSLGCSYCRNSGATVGCCISACHCSFHLPCVTKAKGITIFEGSFPSYCRRHVPGQNLDKWFNVTAETPLCCICLFSILPEDDDEPKVKPKPKRFTVQNLNSSAATIERKLPRRSCVAVSSTKLRLSTSTSTWELPDSSPDEDDAEIPLVICSTPSSENIFPPVLRKLPQWIRDYLNPLPSNRRLAFYESWKHGTIHGQCCPKAWMHRTCIAGFAVSAALHYVKCPYCADKKTFIRSIMDAGIWVPDRDAAWELEPGAYADLVPVDECEDGGEGSSNGNVNGGSTSNNGSGSSHGQTNATSANHRSERPRRRRTTTRRTATPVPLTNTTIVDQSAAGPNPKPVFSLVWSARRVGSRGRTAHRPKTRRYTEQTANYMPKSPTGLSPPQQRTPSRQRTVGLARHTHDVLGVNHFRESRLRQATLGSFIASFRLSSPSQ